MKISLVNYSDTTGGASRAAYRIHRALRASGMDSTLHVNEALSGDWTVHGPKTKGQLVRNRMRSAFGNLVGRLQRTDNRFVQSVALLPSGWPAILNASDADVVHLVWVNGEMLSIEDINRLHKPLIWTLQDMWAFCGTEHLSNDPRYMDGYFKRNRPSGESGVDLNRITWARKRRAWGRPIHMVAPSHWMADCIGRSSLMKDWPVAIIHNPIDTDRWYPVDKPLARKLMGLPEHGTLLLFGTAGTNDAPHKGFDLLREALQSLKGGMELNLAVFGQAAPERAPDLGFPVHYMGHLHDDIGMQLLYSAADAVAIPSRQDNLPNVGIEAIACGTPVVAFDTCGLPDIVRHQATGYLARAFDAGDFAMGIKWLLEDAERHAKICSEARADAVMRFSYPAIAPQYRALYQRVAAGN